MALAEAVQDIIEQMEADAAALKGHTPGGHDLAATLQGYARQLKTAVKASAGVTELPGRGPSLLVPGMPDFAGAQHSAMIEAARQEIRAKKQKKEEQLASMGLGVDGLSTVLCVGGPGDGSYVECPVDVPAGQRTVVAGAVYVMGDDKKAHYNAEQTKQLAAAKEALG